MHTNFIQLYPILDIATAITFCLAITMFDNQIVLLQH